MSIGAKGVKRRESENEGRRTKDERRWLNQDKNRKRKRSVDGYEND